MNVEQARFNMIEQQIRTWEVLDNTVLELLGKVPREDFVPEQYRGLAFADLEIPLGHGETMLQPKLEGRILQALALQKSDKVLEIGTGSGYLTALIAKLAKEVHTVDINAELSRSASQKLAHYGIRNVTFHEGDAATGWAENGPYDAIIFTGSLLLPPIEAQSQLNVNGRLFAVIGQPPVMAATLVRRISEDGYRRDVLFETVLPRLKNAPEPTYFKF